MATVTPRRNRISISNLSRSISKVSNAIFATTNKAEPDNDDTIAIEDSSGNRFYTTVAQLAAAGAGITVLPSHLSSALPTANPAGQVIYISDEAVMAYSDGTNWIS